MRAESVLPTCSFRNASCAVPPFCRTGSTWLPSESDVLVARKTFLSSSAETVSALTLELAMTFTSAAARLVAATIPITAPARRDCRYFIAILFFTLRCIFKLLHVEPESKHEHFHLRL